MRLNYIGAKPLFLLIGATIIILAFSAFRTNENFHSENSFAVLQDSMKQSYLDTVIAWDADLDQSMVTVTKIYPFEIETTKDTIIIFDVDLEEEVEKVVESEHVKSEIILRQPFKGSYYVTDTIVTFNPETQLESIRYEVKKVLKK